MSGEAPSDPNAGVNFQPNPAEGTERKVPIALNAGGAVLGTVAGREGGQGLEMPGPEAVQAKLAQKARESTPDAARSAALDAHQDLVAAARPGNIVGREPR